MQSMQLRKPGEKRRPKPRKRVAEKEERTKRIIEYLQ